jgi:alpha-L-fucosidase
MMGFKQLRDQSLINLIKPTDEIKSSSRVNGHPISFVRDVNKRSFWAADTKDAMPTITFIPKNVVKLNAILVQEPISLGQRVKQFSVLLTDDTGIVEEVKGKTIGNKRILPFKERKIKSIQVKFLDARGQVLISNFEVLRITSQRNEPLYR